MSKQKRLLIMAAGTGGHIFPGLAIARTMRERGWFVSWLGTQHGMEKTLVPAHGVEMDSIDFSGMRGKGWHHTLTGGLRLLMGFGTCIRLLKRRKPDVVLGMGGYVTVPGGFAAKILGIPLVLVNADAALLLSNKTLAPSARKVLFGFPADFGSVADKAEVTGNPVRQEITNLPDPVQRYAGREGTLRVLVLGGSLGAKALNDCVPAAIAMMAPEARPHVTHQAGKQHAAALRLAYIDAQVKAEVIEFIDDMAEQYSHADLVVCRAGAITVSELTAAGVASILVPFIASSTSHQRDNALWMEKLGAARHLPQTELTPEILAKQLESMTREQCLEMAKAAYALGRRDANERIADVLSNISEHVK